MNVFSRMVRPVASDSSTRSRAMSPMPALIARTRTVRVVASRRRAGLRRRAEARRTARVRPAPVPRRGGRRARRSRIARRRNRPGRRLRPSARERRARSPRRAAGRGLEPVERLADDQRDQFIRAWSPRPAVRRPAPRRAARRSGRRSRRPRRDDAKHRSCRRRAPSAAAARRTGGATSSAGSEADGSSSTSTSASTLSARAIATSDFSVRVRSRTRMVGSSGQSTWASAARVAASDRAPVDEAPAARIAGRQRDILRDRHPFDETEILMDEGDRLRLAEARGSMPIGLAAVLDRSFGRARQCRRAS